MTGIKIPVSAEFDGADVEKTVTQLNAQMNKLAQSIAAVNKVSFNPVSKGSLDELKKVEAKFQELVKISGALRDRLKSTGQLGASFGSIDWGRLYDDPTTRARKMAQAFQHVAAGTRYGLGGPIAAPGGGAVPPVPPASGGTGSAIGGALAGIAGAGVRATGPVGGVIANAAGAGISGGFGAGLIGLAGGIAALAVGKGISAIKDKVDAAGAEGIGYDTLKRTLGDVNVSFNLLRESLRAASNNIDVTFEEAQKLGSDFAKLSGISKEQYKTISDEVAIGGGFGRSFGVDPASSNQFFAQMRQFGATSNANDSRRLAIMIGEAVAKSGSFGKTDELLQLIASYTGQQARNGLAAPNVAGYSGLLSGLVGSGIPGLDPQGAAALLGRVNSAIAGGGAIGEAGQNFLFSTLGSRLGLDPVQTALLQQQGAFGTARGAFGPNPDGSPGLYQQFSARFGGGLSRGVMGDDKTNLSAILERTQQMYAGNPSLMLNATARLLGVNESQAMALHTIGPQQLTGMTGRMARMGLDLGKLSSTGISALSNIEAGTDDTLRAQAAALGNSSKPLTSDERKRLDAALAGGDTEQLKDILTELTYSREQEKTEGSKTRESIQSVDKRIQELATHLVGPMNDMRNALVHMAGGGKLGATGIAEAVMRTESREKMDNARTKNSADIEAQRAIIKGVGVNDATGELGALHEDLRKKLMGTTDKKELADARAEYTRKRAELVAKREAAQKRIVELMEEMSKAEDTEKKALEDRVKELKVSAAGMQTSTKALENPEKVMTELAKTDQIVGLAPGTSAAQIKKESGFNPGAYNRRSGAMGMAQVMPKTLAALEKRFGRKLDPFNENDAILIHREVMRENKERFGTDAGALAAYNSGWNPGRWGNSETVDYLSKIERWRGGFTPMPEGAKRGAPYADTPKVTIEGTFNLQGQQNGSRAAEPIVIKKTVDAPRASGV